VEIYLVSFAQIIGGFAFICAMLSIALSMFMAVFFFGRKYNKKIEILPLLALNPIGVISSLIAISIGFERAVQVVYISSPFIDIYIASIFSML